jgi:hypothetical protein
MSLDYKIHPYDKWMTEWSYYVGEEDLGKIRIFKTRFGLHTSVHEDGHQLITCVEFDTCKTMTYWHLKWKRDGYDGELAVFDGVVGGKL